MTGVSGQAAANQLALVALDRRMGEERDLRIGDRHRGLDLPGQGAQSRAEHQADPRRACPVRPDRPRGFLNVFPFVMSHRIPEGCGKDGPCRRSSGAVDRNGQASVRADLVGPCRSWPGLARGDRRTARAQTRNSNRRSKRRNRGSRRSVLRSGSFRSRWRYR